MAQKVELHQFAFNGGELHPAMHARSDMEKYAVGAEKIRNLVARPYGGAHKRVGTHCIGETLGNGRSCLVEFEFNAAQRYMLEFGDYQFRIIYDDAFVAYPEGHAKEGEIVVINSPYSLKEAHQFDYDQNADLMIITHRNHPVRNLIRYDHHDWRFRDHDLERHIFAPAGLRIVTDGNRGSRYCVVALKDAEMSFGSNVVECHLTTADEYLPVPNVNELTFTQLRRIWRDDLGQPTGVENEYGQLWRHEWEWDRWLNIWNGRPWDYPLTSSIISTFWTIEAIRQLAAEWIPQYIGPASYSWSQPYNIITGPDGTQVSLLAGNQYIEQMVNLWIQFVNVIITNGATGATANYHGTLYDKPLITMMREMILDYYNAENDKISPGVTDLAWEPSAGATSYFVFREGQYEDEDGNTIKGFFYVGTAAAGVTAFTDNNYPLDVTIGLPVAGDDGENPFDRPGRYPGVCSFYVQRALFGATDEKPASFWASQIGVYNNFDKHSPIQDDDSFNYTLNSKQVNQLLWMIPMNALLLGTAANEWRAGGGSVALGPKNPDVSLQTWRGCAAVRPAIVGRSVVFAGKSRRNLRDFAYSLESDVFDGNDLTLYAQHLFENRRIVEGHGFCYQREPDSIIWAVMDDGALLSCTYLPEQKVVCWSRHDTAGRFESTNCLADANGEDRVYFVVAREINGRIVRFLEVMKEPLVPTDDLAEAFYVDCGLTYRGPETTALLGLEHLEGRDVSVLADGFRRSARVKDGRIELAHPASVVHVGLGYACELDTLDMQPNQQPVKNRSARAIVGAEAHFYKSIECKAGPTGGKAYEVFRSERDGTPTLYSGKKRFNPATPSEPDGYRLHFEMDAPYPLSILAVSALGEVGGS